MSRQTVTPRGRPIAIVGFTLALVGCGSGGGGANGGSGGHAGTGGAAGHAGAGGSLDGGASDGASACGAAIGPGGVNAGTMRWQDNGTPECAFIIEQTRMTSASLDFLDIIGVAMDSNHAIDLAVSAYGGSSLGGAYACGSGADGGANATLQVTSANVISAVPDCTITITHAGTATAHAQGTFSGTATGEGGAATVITNGVFDVVVTPAGG
jgi:hypothetical protein